MNKLTKIASVLAFLYAPFMMGFVIIGFFILMISQDLPDANSIKNVELKVPLRVYSADNILISEFGSERRKPTSIEEFPQAMIDSVLASEDDRFFSHHGVDFMGLVRAAISNFSSGYTQQGASTITMQVARNFFLTHEKTYTRKLNEIVLAIKLEQILSKQEILSLYLNKIFLGHRAYGFGAAAQVYYGKPIQELELAQIAMLAGLPKAPSKYNPITNPQRALKRRNYVLKRLRELDKISAEVYQANIEQPVTAKKQKYQSNLNAPHIAEMVRARLLEVFGEDIYWQGLNVYTTIQSEQQLAANTALRQGLKNYDKRHGFRGAVEHIDLNSLKKIEDDATAHLDEVLDNFPNSQEQVPAIVLNSDTNSAQVYNSDTGNVTLTLKQSLWAKRHKTAYLVGDPPNSMKQLVKAGDIIYIEPASSNNKQHYKLSQIPNVSGALLSIEPKTGRIISLIGGYDFFLNKYNRATQSIRQPGSNIKPFIYSAALDHGLTPASLISGAPIVITDPSTGTLWRPENYSGKFYGPTRMREALAKSMNLVSIRLLRAIGLPVAREYVERFGINTQRFSKSLTMALGSGGVTPLEMLTAFGVLANGGYKVNPYFIEKITDRNGEVIYTAQKPKFCDKCYQRHLTTDDNVLQTTDGPGETSDAHISTQKIESDKQEPSDNLLDEQFYVAPRVMNQVNNFLTVSMLKDVIRVGTARKALKLKRADLAGKTGTTNDYVDAWFSGFNSKVATTVWVGFDEPATMGRGEAGSSTALPIWVDYMKTALKDIPQDPDTVPEFIEQGFIDKYTGKRCDKLDPNAIPEYFVTEALSPNRPAQEITPSNDFSETLQEIEQLDSQPEERIIESDGETEGLFN